MSEEFYPWEVVNTARYNQALQQQFREQLLAPEQMAADIEFGISLEDGFTAWYKKCPQCGRSPADLAWFWFSSPEADWQALGLGSGSLAQKRIGRLLLDGQDKCRFVMNVMFKSSSL